MPTIFTGDVTLLFNRNVRSSAPAEFRDSISPGTPVSIIDSKGAFAFWRVPLLAATTDVGFMDVDGQNQVQRFGFQGQSIRAAMAQAPTVLGMTRDSIKSLAATVLGEDTPQSPPVLITLDGAAQIAWQVKSARAGDTRVALVTPGVAFLA